MSWGSPQSASSSSTIRHASLSVCSPGILGTSCIQIFSEDRPVTKGCSRYSRECGEMRHQTFSSRDTAMQISWCSARGEHHPCHIFIDLHNQASLVRKIIVTVERADADLPKQAGLQALKVSAKTFEHGEYLSYLDSAGKQHIEMGNYRLMDPEITKLTSDQLCCSRTQGTVNTVFFSLALQGALRSNSSSCSTY